MVAGGLRGGVVQALVGKQWRRFVIAAQSSRRRAWRRRQGITPSRTVLLMLLAGGTSLCSLWTGGGQCGGGAVDRLHAGT